MSDLSTIPWLEIGLGVGGLVVLQAWLEAFRRTGRAIGKVTGIETRSGPDGDDTRVPVITFHAGSRKYSFHPSLVLIGEARASRVGSELPVAYDPANPKDAEVAVPYRLYLPPAVVTILYGAFVYWILA